MRLLAPNRHAPAEPSKGLCDVRIIEEVLVQHTPGDPDVWLIVGLEVPRLDNDPSPFLLSLRQLYKGLLSSGRG